MEMGAGWRICGVVERKYVSPKGAFAEMTLAYPDRGKTAKLKVVAFKEMVTRVAEVGQGQIVQVTGGFWVAAMTDKAKQPVKVDGRDAFETKHVIRAITVDGENQEASKPEDSISPPQAPAADLDDPRDNDWK